MKKKISNPYVIYFVNLIASGFFYSYMTTKMINFGIKNSLIIILLSSVVDLLLIFDIQTFRFSEKLPINWIPFITLVITGILLCLQTSTNNILVFLMAYFFISLMFSIVLLVFQTKIIIDELNLTMGFLNMQLLRNIAKMFGFFLGNIFGSIDSDKLFLYLCLVILLINIFIIMPYREKSKLEETIATRKVNQVSAYFFLGFLSTATVLWIPLLTKTFFEHHLLSISWLPFILPGVISTILLYVQKKTGWFIHNTVIEFCYFITFVAFFILRIEDSFPILQSVIFSFLVAFDLSLSVKIRKNFLQSNNKNNIKFLMQSLAVSSSIFSLIFSLFGKNNGIVELLLFVACIITAGYLIKKKDVYS